jgi:hypothetical protein
LVLREDKDFKIVPLTNNEYYCFLCKCRFHALIVGTEPPPKDEDEDKEEEKERVNTVILKCPFCHAEVYDSRIIRKAIKKGVVHAHRSQTIVELQLMKMINKLNKEQPRCKPDICVVCGEKLPPSKSWNITYCSKICRNKARLIKDVKIKEELDQVKKMLRIGKYSYLNKESTSPKEIYREHEPLRE